MKAPAIRCGTYGGEPSLVLRAGDYEATVLPGIGGHLVALRDVRRGLRLVREPLARGRGDLSAYRGDPIPYGIPLLFPPNRIEDGSFRCCGQSYRFPINEPRLHNHLHGFFARTPWQVTARRGGESARLLLRRRLRAGDAEYHLFPHALTLELLYELSPQGLRHAVRARNESGRPMPFLLGFHTALSVPFSARSTSEDCAVYMNIGDKWELTERKLPSGKTVAKDAMEEGIAQGRGDPFAHPIDALFDAVPRGGPNECRVLDRRTGDALVYETDPKFRFWMLWNRDGRSGFFCPEPMTCMVNAPNLDLPWEVSGMQTLAPHQEWSAACRLFLAAR